MPYIPSFDRVALNAGISQPTTPGKLNYKITRILLDSLGENPNYERYNAVIGVLECVKLELYRRMIAPYEETKRAEHGDVYPPTGE